MSSSTKRDPSAPRTTGVLFKPPMVRAILRGDKSQTRRIVIPQPALVSEVARLERGVDVAVPVERAAVVGSWVHFYAPLEHAPGKAATGGMWTTRAKLGAVGDYLWVRETWRARSTTGVSAAHGEQDAEWFEYLADYPNGDTTRPWRPPLFMPREASRLRLRITDLRVERLQDISEEDAIAEGVETDVWDQALVARKYDEPDAWFQMWSETIRTMSTWRQ